MASMRWRAVVAPPLQQLQRAGGCRPFATGQGIVGVRTFAQVVDRVPRDREPGTHATSRAATPDAVLARGGRCGGRLDTGDRLSPSPSSSFPYHHTHQYRQHHHHYHHHEILHSAFPKKTFFALLALGVAGWYFLDVRLEESWMQRLRGGPADNPLHFYESKEVVEHVVEAHIPDPLDAGDVGAIIDQYSEHFADMIGAWAMTEDQAKEVNMPVTHGAQTKSNEPCEDFYALGTSPGVGAEPWNYWGVFDGHAGNSTSRLLQATLIPFVSRNLSNLPAGSSSQVIAQNVMRTFTRLDNDWMSSAKRAVHWYPALHSVALNAVLPVFSGSCALLASFDPKASKLHVACTGDSRAVLGRWDSMEGKYVAQALSIDQTGFNQEEVSRIHDAHPDETDIIDPKSGRLLGMAVTRAFGDHRWKWDDSTILQAQYKFFGSPPRPKSKTPPYMTAEPVVTETDIQRGENPDFMIMASDGLWDNISSEHAVELVQSWIDARARGNGAVKDAPSFNPAPPFSTLPNRLDSGVDFNYDAEHPETNQYPTWRATPEHFTIEDENAAVCLIRNAFGGRRRGLFSGLFSLPPGTSRMAMDDTTVLVVFFGGLDRGKKGAQAQESVKKDKKWWKPW